MPTPTKPVVPGLEPFEITFGEGQEHEGIVPLTTLRKPDGTVYSRWTPNEAEREDIGIRGADIYIGQCTYFRPPMPLIMEILNPKLLGNNPDVTLKNLGLNTELMHRLNSDDPMKSPVMMLTERKMQLLEQPKKFDSAETYFAWKEAMHSEWLLRDRSQAEMDFEEWQMAEIVRLRQLLLEYIKTV